MKVLVRRNTRSQRGVALVLAIFTLMLISVIATSLILMTGTSVAIKANYKSSMEAFYDAKAGLEEGRSRLWPGNPGAVSNCVFANGNPVPVNHVCYITNPDAAGGETAIDPTNSSDPYADTEYANEFGPLSGATVNQVTSNSPLTSPNIAGPLYKWVRITPRTQASAGVGLDGGPPPTDSSGNEPLYYDGAQQFAWGGVGPPANSSQVLTVTALAKTPAGGFSGTRLLQYTVAQNPNPLGQALVGNNGAPPLTGPPLSNPPILQAALTLDGNGNTYSGGNGASAFPIKGLDASGPPNSGIGGIAYTNSTDAVPSCNCTSPSGMQNVGQVTLPDEMQTPQGLNALVNAVTQDASVVLTGPADQSNLPAGMSATNPMIVVVNGDFHLTHANGASAFMGYGLLLVTGTLYYDPDDSWNGIILVIGKGVFNGSQNGHNGQINGAVVVANTLDSSGNLLKGPLGPASFNGTGGGNGIHYNSSYVKNIQSNMPYQVLSFREIQQQ